MRQTERYPPHEMADYTIGWEAEGFRGEGDYAEYVQTYIMWPLSSGRRAERKRPATPAARAGAGAGVLRMARVRGRSGPRRGRGVGWPALPTMMTYRGQSGEIYQIPIAPPLADHELVGFYDLPPASSEYTCQSLELNASMIGMLQRSLDLLALYSIPLWVYAYFSRLAPVPDEETPLDVPFSRRFDVRSRESFIFFCRYFDTITAAEPWAPLPAAVRERYASAEEIARFKILLEGPVCRAWYLGECFLRQTLGLLEPIAPGPPPINMR
ncbi:uncharacterized protein LOC114319608 isoform X1 [Camellia sinensis]|uniref:uncharacterized protein LOC114319608 isoform X1 n=1 Tax=Camellia sinensis TaxID=4442 RepID=UPI001035C73F|nr:uncharacterized protein LOC114319608 isoform X1 [Camellia sinensis]